MSDPIRETLASWCHDQWRGTMDNLWTHMQHRHAGWCLVGEDAEEDLFRKRESTYAELPEEEKDSDRQEADKLISLLLEQGWTPPENQTRN